MIRPDNISFDHCIKCTVCNIYCPVAKVTHLFPGPKLSGPDAERLRIKNPGLLDASLKYCTNCKRCEIVCPSGVMIADIIQNAKWNYLKKRFSLKNFMLSRMDLLGKLLAPFSIFVNFFMSLSVTKFFLDKLIGIASGQTFPKFQSGSFAGWFRKKAPDQTAFPDQAVYFHGCSVNRMDHQLGKDLVRVLNTINVGLSIPKQKCCGVPAIANSNIKKAKKNARYNISSLEQAAKESGKKIITTCSSGCYALKYEYKQFLAMNNSGISERINYITYFLYNKFKAGIIPEMKPVNIKAVYHSPCHLERMGGVMYTIDILKRIPGLELIILHSECCGLSGTYGFKKEYFKISKDIGSELFNQINRLNPDMVITDCVTCKWQIENFTSYRVIHPVSLLAKALKT